MSSPTAARESSGSGVKRRRASAVFVIGRFVTFEIDGEACHPAKLALVRTPRAAEPREPRAGRRRRHDRAPITAARRSEPDRASGSVCANGATHRPDPRRSPAAKIRDLKPCHNHNLNLQRTRFWTAKFSLMRSGASTMLPFNFELFAVNTRHFAANHNLRLKGNRHDDRNGKMVQPHQGLRLHSA